jgi:hypothetical protein
MLVRTVYAELHINAADQLYDAQTGEVLAEVWNGEPPRTFIKGGPDNPSLEETRKLIERAMTDDRKQ